MLVYVSLLVVCLSDGWWYHRPLNPSDRTGVNLGINGTQDLDGVRAVLREASGTTGTQKIKKQCRKWINKREGQVGSECFDVAEYV